MSESMVEAVAKDMAEREGWRWDDDRQMLDCAAAGLQNTGRERDTWRNRARAAIEAMREPTGEMIIAGEVSTRGDGVEWHLVTTDSIFTAMIGAALKP